MKNLMKIQKSVNRAIPLRIGVGHVKVLYELSPKGHVGSVMLAATFNLVTCVRLL